MADKKIKIEYCEMSKDMVNLAVSIVRDIEKNKTPREIALHMKKEFDNKFFPTWQCVAGKLIPHLKAKILAQRLGSKRTICCTSPGRVLPFFCGRLANLLILSLWAL